MPALIGGNTTSNGTYVMIGAETVKVASVSGTVGAAGSWVVNPNVLGDIATALPQCGGTNPTWQAGTPILQISSYTGIDTGDDADFNQAGVGTCAFWQALVGGAMNALACVQARHDKLIKAKCAMAVDEMIYDLKHYVELNFSNPCVPITTSDNGWLYGNHQEPTGKINPYLLASVWPLFIQWPQQTNSKYPYFTNVGVPVKPNILVFMTDDDDAVSLSGNGYPILNGAVSQTETALITHYDITATMIDLAGARPYTAIDGISFAPIASSANHGGSYRKYISFGLRKSPENGNPSFWGIQTADQRIWLWQDFDVSAYTSVNSGGNTAAQVNPGHYAGIYEGYDHTGAFNNGNADPGELQSIVGSGAFAQELGLMKMMLSQSIAEVPAT
jgi:hypothetical protein